MITKLKQARLAAGLTQSQLASKTGINIRTLQYYEQGRKKIECARLESILKICIVLNVEINEIIDDQKLLDLYEQYINPAQ